LVAGYGWPLVTDDKEAPQRTESGTALAPTWQDRALNTQALIDRASVEVSPESQANEDLVALQMAQALGPDFKLPNFDADGFKFVRGQLLSFGGRPLAQLLYLGQTKPPLALYATADRTGTSGALTFRQADALGALSWSEGGLTYLLAGVEDEDTLRRLAGSIGNGGSSAARPSAGTDPVVTGSH
jgi:anti-sigma factor RsiW